MNYCIVNISDISNIIWNQVVEDRNTIRYNIPRDKFIVRYIGSKPSFLNSYTSYDVEAMLGIINNINNDWFEILEEDQN